MGKDKTIEKAMDIWRDHAILREGYRTTVYADSLGKPTVGIGHLVRFNDGLKIGDTITEKKVMEFFEEDSQDALELALWQAEQTGIMNADWLAALISVNFQLGDWTKKFYNTWPLLKEGHWQAAIKGLNNSAWARQTPVRVKDFVQAIEREYA